MRKHILSVFTLFTLVMLLASCGAQKKSSSGAVSTSSSVAVDGPSAAQWRSGLKGKWVLNSVDREDIPGSYTIKNIFDEAPVDCFVGSVWTLPGGNYRGSIAFNASGTLCADGAVRTIVWSVYDVKTDDQHPQFQFKKIYSGEKAANVTSGYRLNLSYSDGQSLVMRMPIPLDNGTGNLVFNFTKVQD
ncbi:lipocalin family protein [Sphingobacterium sp. LRF_L2]|uniref:lipocalin family protein n=1 Tax=Sphingobacterium sp. LRF_L2 TaxID=3369421 RepID=UPI003F613EA9